MQHLGVKLIILMHSRAACDKYRLKARFVNVVYLYINENLNISTADKGTKSFAYESSTKLPNIN